MTRPIRALDRKVSYTSLGVPFDAKAPRTWECALCGEVGEDRDNATLTPCKSAADPRLPHDLAFRTPTIQGVAPPAQEQRKPSGKYSFTANARRV